MTCLRKLQFFTLGLPNFVGIWCCLVVFSVKNALIQIVVVNGLIKLFSSCFNDIQIYLLHWCLAQNHAIYLFLCAQGVKFHVLVCHLNSLKFNVALDTHYQTKNCPKSTTNRWYMKCCLLKVGCPTCYSRTFHLPSMICSLENFEHKIYG